MKQNIINKLKNKFAAMIFAGSGMLYAYNSFSQDSVFVKNDTLNYKYAEYKSGLFVTEKEEISALDTNKNGVCDYVIKNIVTNHPFGKKNLVCQIWKDFDEDGAFDEYELETKTFNVFNKEKSRGNFISTNTKEINQNYALPRFDGKKLDWKNNISDKLE